MTDFILKTDNLTIGYDSDIVRSISIKAVPGQILTLIGPNGCGKSTLLRTLTGQLKNRSGIIYLNGSDLGSLKAGEIARQLSMVMTSVVKPELMTCREVISTGRYPYTGRLGVLTEHDRQVIEETITMTGTQDIAGQLFMSVSDGQKQRVMLARAICQEPEILILDEPTSYLDIKYKLDILTRIKQLIKERNIAVIMSLHELDIAMRISDTVAAIGEGSVLRCGRPAEVFEEDFIRELYGIEGADLELIGATPWFEPTPEAGVKPYVPNVSEDNTVSHNSGADKTTVLNPDSRNTETDATDLPNSGSSQAKIVRKAAAIMIQGTMSGAGKSLITAGLCRIFADDGYRVAPFKSQNMALNSYITSDGGEMGRAQVVQAECARREPEVSMNPILLKPNDDRTSQIIINGRVAGNKSAAEYFRYKKDLMPVIKEAYDKLAGENDIIVIEGAGSPVELNLNKNDIVNMGIAEMTDAAVLLVGDIDRGGVFAQLIGTLDLLTPEERARVKGLIVNKFRGDPSLFDEGIQLLEEKSHTDVLGVVPYMDLNIEDEDSLSDKLYVNRPEQSEQSDRLDIAVIGLPHISNYTDFDIFGQSPETAVRYVRRKSELCKPDSSTENSDPDIIIIPGSKNTVSDLKWLMDSGLGDAIKKQAEKDTVIIGICGGYQMLGRTITETCGNDSHPAGTVPENTTSGTDNPDGSTPVTGLGLLPVDTFMEQNKTTARYTGRITAPTGVLAGLSGLKVEGYEIHMGRSVPCEDISEFTSGGTGYCVNNIYGTYVHGLFDRGEVLSSLLSLTAGSVGKSMDTGMITDRRRYREEQYELLAGKLRECLDIDAIYGILGIDGKQKQS